MACGQSSCSGSCWTTAICGNSCLGSCAGLCDTTCSGSCSGACTSGCSYVSQCGGSCAGSCWSGCTGACTTTCSSSCTGTCSGSCTGTCTSTCSGSCSGTCSGSCGGACSNNCTGSCSNNCTETCGSQCIGEAMNVIGSLMLTTEFNADNMNEICEAIVYEAERRKNTSITSITFTKDELIDALRINEILNNLNFIGYPSDYSQVNFGDTGLKEIGNNIIEKIIAAWKEEIIT